MKNWSSFLVGVATMAFLVAAAAAVYLFAENQKLKAQLSAENKAVAQFLDEAAATVEDNLTKAAAVSRQTACLNNLRMIDSAVQQWALEQGKADSDRPELSDLAEFLPSGMPTCPDGESYQIGSVGDKPHCPFPGHDLRH